MATTWIPEEGVIPEEQLGVSVSEETTDGKLTALLYTPTYTSPVDDKETTGKEVKVTDAAKLKAYSAAAKDDPDNAYLKALPTFNMEGTYYRAGSGRDTSTDDAVGSFEKQKRDMMSACSSYSGAQFAACQKAVNARISQMAKASGFATGGLVNEQNTTQDYNNMMQRKTYADGGAVMMDDTPSLMEPLFPEDEMPMPEDEDMMSTDGTLVDRIISVLNEEEKQVLDEAFTMHPELISILDKADSVLQDGEEFVGEGPVNGPGTETSDSIPARLSDGEFVFTAKAVKQIGVDKLRKMMAKAEEDYDSGMEVQESEQLANMDMEEGYAMGGLLDQARKQFGNLESATAEFAQPMEMDKPTNVNGMGRQVPEGEVGIMGRETVDLAAQQAQSAEAVRRAENTGLMSATPAQAPAADTAQRQQETQQLQKGAEEEQLLP